MFLLMGILFESFLLPLAVLPALPFAFVGAYLGLWVTGTDQDVVATLYHNLGIDPGSTTITDPSGRPHYLLDKGRPISELV